MLSTQDQLTELVRQLETDNYVFAVDPLLITEKLQNEVGSPREKLHHRAAGMDKNGNLAKTLHKIDARIKGIVITMSVLWCAFGFMGLFTLLQTNIINFFYVLVCLLGFHTLMLVGWILLTLANQHKQSPSIIASFINPKALIRGKDSVTLAAVNLYNQQLHHAGMRWYISKFSHQLWLATLTGMLLAIIFLLIVRQYSFSWESTLLSDATMMQLTNWLGWLPSLIGFNVPDPNAVIQSRLTTDAMPLSIAKQWASLLIGSLLMYGILPRAIAWAFCTILFYRNKMTLDISLPYYNKIISFWQQQVVDDDDFTNHTFNNHTSNNQASNNHNKPVAPIAKISQGAKVVALLEYPFNDTHWYRQIAEQGVEDMGIIDGRDDMQRLLDYLEYHDVQVLLGIPMQALPDRGTLRRLNTIAKHAKQGLIVQLLININLSEHGLSSDPALRKQQWQTALSKLNIGLVE